MARSQLLLGCRQRRSAGRDLVLDPGNAWQTLVIVDPHLTADLDSLDEINDSRFILGFGAGHADDSAPCRRDFGPSSTGR